MHSEVIHVIVNLKEVKIMEYYIEIIIMLAPGFIAKEVARALGNVKSRSSSIDQVLNYFVYSIFCVFITLLLYTIINQLFGNDKPQNLLLVFLAILSGFGVGYAWQVIVKKEFKRIIDKYTSEKDGYTYFQEDSMLNNCMLDGKDHLIQIIKSGNVVATGRFLGATFSSEDTAEIKIDSHPTYARWLSDERYRNHFEYLHSIFDIKHDIEVREYSYPNGFFKEGFSADNITSSEQVAEVVEQDEQVCH